MYKRIFKVGFAALVVALLGLAVLFFPTESKADTLYDYDNFDGVRLINSELWHAANSEQFDKVLDATRRIVIGKKLKGELQLGLTAYSDSGGEPGLGLRFSNPYYGGPQNITAIEAEVKVGECEFTEPCGEGWEHETVTRLTMMGSFFSTGLEPVPPTCADGGPPSWDEVHAATMLQSIPDQAGESFKSFNVVVRIYQHPWNQDFDKYFNLGQELGWTVEKGEGVILGIRWNQANQSFVFRMNDETHEISYGTWLEDIGGTDMDPPCGGFKSIGNDVLLPTECNANAMGSSVFYIDNVRIETAPPWNGD